ncbi:FtsX-like permease family protein [Emticicia sp. BO119]|uniref:FtsX-like permease family protein n=1 Tax=Emticicia sp. BO119 TaxID=2757768 RepID=UPI0015F0C8D1|nr:FtsX-like permease family protein [Emticicia sp. BO119]MBA4850877.1 ABC transporter permease [Emticicia sp. BO119]
MLLSYFKIAFRNLVKNKVYSFINIGGLAVGMSVAILIGLWIYDELSYDKYHKNYESIAQIRSIGTDPNTGITRSGTALQFPIGTSLKNNYKHYFKNILLAFWVGDYTLSSVNEKYPKKGEFIDGEVIDMLSLKMLKGSAASLQDPHSIILSKSTADAIFGSVDPLNKNLKIDNRMDVVVRGVYEDLPKNNRFNEVQFFSPWALWVSSNDWVKSCENEWENSSFNVYVQTQPNISVEQANIALKDFYDKNAPKQIAEEWRKYNPGIFLYPMKQWHLYSEFKDGKVAGGRITFVWLFGIVGIFVLLLACINFMNLSTARSEKRAKEVGIRKAIGSIRVQLVQQFLSESFLVVLFAFALAVGLVLLSLPWFNNLADKDMSIPFTNPVFWAISIAFILFTAGLAGVYPAFYLSSFQPVKVLKGTFKLGRFASLPRKVLVVVQFTVSVVLIVGTIVVYQQIKHARNRPVGYNREGLIKVSLNDPNYQGKQDVIKTQLINTGMVKNMALSSSPMTEIWSNAGGYNWKGKDPELASDFAVINVTHDFGKLVDWKIIAGRDFSRAYATDSNAIIINETAAKYMGLKNPIGEFITNPDEGAGETWQIIGVVKDLVMQSPYDPVKRSFYFLDPKYVDVSQMIIKIKPTVSASEALPKIEAVFKEIVPSALFDYRFVDQEYGNKFSQEERIGKLASFFALLAILISCLGLFGLASFVAEQRTKEIGIRKVLGASIGSLWGMLSKDFVVLVVISSVVAAPIAYYFMNQWLEKYKYHTEISWWIFVLTGMGALGITLLTVSYQAIKAALMNPIKSLKTE